MQISQILKTFRIFGGTMVAELFGSVWVDAAIVGQLVTITYSAAPVPDVALGNAFVVTTTDGVAFVFGVPLNPPPVGFSQNITITIRNTSGGAHGAITFNAIYLTTGAFAAVATGNNRTIGFSWNGTNWVETFVSAADVPN
jgi:hypothetical protein